MFFSISLNLLLATLSFADGTAAKGSSQFSEMDAALETLGRVYKIEKHNILNYGKPKPPKNVYLESNPNHVPYPYAKTTPLDIDGETLGLCMALVTKAPFAYDKSKAICKPINLGNGKTKNTNPQAPILSYLSGAKRECDLTSGHEDELHQWILEQRNNSIDPVIIYAKSMELNNGNIWNALLTIHQELRNNARWVQGWRYDYDSTADKQRRFFNKFIDIRGDLEQRGADFHGDHFGNWYRIWGAMLYRLNLLKEDDFKAGLPRSRSVWGSVAAFPGQKSRAMLGALKDWHADAVFYSDEFLKIYVEKGETDLRKYGVDRAGSDAMASLVEGLWSPALPVENELTVEKCMTERPYLKEVK